MRKKNIGVILSGCGHRDGTEIHEVTLTLLAIHRHGAEYQCYAPDMEQVQVINHLTGQVMPEKRNVLVESARIARGKIIALHDFDADKLDGLVIPGGLGAAKNLSSYAFDGAQCLVYKDVARAICDMAVRNKPIGALCIAPVIIAKVLSERNVMLTIGQDKATVENLVTMGARHTPTNRCEVVVDRHNKIVTTPCYMLDSRVDEIAAGADKVIVSMLELM